VGHRGRRRKSRRNGGQHLPGRLHRRADSDQQIGNTTFSATGATYSVPDKTRPILYVPQTFTGDTANNPQPPTQAQALAAARKVHHS